MKSDRFTVKVNGIILFIIIAALIVATVFITFKFADKVYYSNAIVTDGKSVVFDGKDTSREKIAKFNDLLEYIKDNYYYGYDENKIIEGALKGIAESLDDPYTKYYEPGTMSKYNNFIDGTDETGESIQTVNTVDFNGKIKYIRITRFGSQTSNEFKTAVSAIMTDGTKGIILDLRDNPGGIETEASAIADILLPSGTIATAEDKNGNTVKTIVSDESEISLPMVVLVNGNTASAAELLAAALADFDKAELVGTKTYGKAVGQKSHTYDFDDSGIKITVWKYYTPSGKCINEVGITPDHVVEPDTDKPVSELKDGEDNQLEKALELIRGH